MKRLCTLLVVVCACGGQGPKETNEGGAPVAKEAEENEVASDAGIQEQEDESEGSVTAAAGAPSEEKDAGPVSGNVEPKPQAEPKTLRFEWCPSKRVAEAYEASDPQNQHSIVLTKGVEPGGAYPVVVAFHGQPKRGRDPKDYVFPPKVVEIVSKMVEDGEINPVILVVPVFRFVGGNWPWFNVAKFRKKVEEILAENQVDGTGWYLFGHSGAAGCGGGGLNQAHLAKPSAVGYFDTCLGTGWEDALAELDKRKIPTLNLHSVETAGFKPKQRPEYQADFDFGRAYGPAGMNPVKCPEKDLLPKPELRKLKHRCSASKSRVLKAFVIDTGEGLEAHQNIVEPAVRFFLKTFCGLGKVTTE